MHGRPCSAVGWYENCHDCAQFQPISEVENSPVGSVVDIIGIVETVGEYTDITLKNGSATHKRSVQLKDQSNASIEVRTPATAWSLGNNISAQVRAFNNYSWR